MSKNKIVFCLYDGRYHSRPDRAVCYEVCDTLDEANGNKDDYGTDTVIVKETLEPTGKKNEFRVVSTEVITTDQ